LTVLVAVLLLPSEKADAGPVSIEVGQQIASVPGPLAYLNSCTVAVDANPDGGTDLVACSATGHYVEIFCENRSTTSVFYGSATDDLDSVAPCVSTDTANCQRDAFRFSVRNGQLGADTASGSATLYCTEGR
jgi:hypothetical protein